MTIIRACLRNPETRAKMHNTKFRRPVILNDADIEVWQDSSLTEVIIENVIDDDMPDELLTAYSYPPYELHI